MRKPIRRKDIRSNGNRVITRSNMHAIDDAGKTITKGRGLWHSDSISKDRRQ
jgi:hypothetical protein